MPIYDTAAAWPRRALDCLPVDDSKAVLLGHPGDFDVEEAQNAHMRAADGSLQRIDPQRALLQWQALRDAYESIGIQTQLIESGAGLADLCFTANPSLVLACPDSKREVWLATMRHPSRRPETALHADFHRARGAQLHRMPSSVDSFEGCGDGVQHPRRFLMHAGVGPRSTGQAWDYFAETHPQLDILRYQLVDERFYHLDTALAPLDEQTALYVPEAFDAEGRGLVEAAFPRAIALPMSESMSFAGNAHCPDGQHVLIDAACTESCVSLRQAGYTPIPLDTSEFRKAGGSVFCLKLAL